MSRIGVPGVVTPHDALKQAQLASQTTRRAWEERKKNIRLRQELVTLRALVAMMRSHLQGTTSRVVMEEAIVAYEAQLVLRTLGEEVGP